MTSLRLASLARRLGLLPFALAAGLGCQSADPEAWPPTSVSAGPRASAAPALAYGKLRDARRGPNADVHRSVSTDLAERLPGLDDEVVQTDEDRATALQARNRLRAYEGAPPTVPHEVTQATLDCAGCHSRGGVLADRTAPRMSHGPMPSCTQCHVPEALPRGMREAALPDPGDDNTFVGLRGPLRGERAYAGAPPTIPHATRMRGECASCHGPSGKIGLRTPHPFQASCTQCHAPSALLDQVPGTEILP